MRLSERQGHRHGGRYRVRRRQPHRLEVEHMDRNAVGVGRVHHGGLKTMPPHRRLRFAAEAFHMLGEQSARLLRAARGSHRDSVRDRLSHATHALLAKRLEPRRRNDVA